jgi:flagellar hook-basal body complex protein FliE
MEIKGIPISDQLKMMKGVAGVRPIEEIDTQHQGPNKSGKISFGEFLSKQFATANADGVEAEKAIQQSLTGEQNNPHSTVIAVQKASVSLTLMMSIKERLERSYQELIRMQIG